MPAFLLRRAGAYAEGESGRPTAPDMISVYPAISIQYLATVPLHANTRRLLRLRSKAGGTKMKSKTLASVVSGLGFAAMGASPQAFAQSHPEYIRGLAHGVKAVLYRPDSNPTPHVGVIVIHRTSNYLNHAACKQL